MNNKKIYIGLVIIIFLLIVIIPFINNYINNNKSYIILSDSEIFSLDGSKLKEVTYDIENQLDITSISESTDNLTFTYKDGLILLYSDSEPINFPDDFHFAYSSKLNLELLDYKYEEVTKDNLEKFDDILEKHDIIGYTDLNISSKLSYDFDGDGNKEEIYFASNLFDEDSYDKVFSFVYYIKDDEIIYLQEDVAEVAYAYDLCLTEVNSLFKLNNQKYVILKCRYFSNKGVQSKMYQYKNGILNLMN